jgi:hypothetical protein
MRVSRRLVRSNMLSGKQHGAEPVFFAYHIVPKGSHTGQALERGTCNAPEIVAAKRHVQTVAAPSVAGKSGLEVILLDSGGAEIWRGPYLGHA